MTPTAPPRRVEPRAAVAAAVAGRTYIPGAVPLALQLIWHAYGRRYASLSAPAPGPTTRRVA